MNGYTRRGHTTAASTASPPHWSMAPRRRGISAVERLKQVVSQSPLTAPVVWSQMTPHSRHHGPNTAQTRALPLRGGPGAATHVVNGLLWRLCVLVTDSTRVGPCCVRKCGGLDNKKAE